MRNLGGDLTPEQLDRAEARLAGIDDATKCPCIGSIYVAGVVAGPELIDEWKSLGVKDSKLLTRKRRDELDRVIRRSAGVHSVLHLPPALIDDKELNLNEWEMLIVLKILQNMRRRVAFSRVRIDNWETSAAGFHRRFEEIMDRRRAAQLREKKVSLRKSLLRGLELIPEHRADETYVVVGAASILARAASDRQYDRIRKIYGDFGSGSPGDPKTRAFVWRHRKAPVPIIRRSWQTFKTLCRVERLCDDPWHDRRRTARR
jgi:ribonuclease HII